MPSFVYIPTDIYSKPLYTNQTVLRICEDFFFCFFSKEKVPYHILLEMVEVDDEITNSKRESFHTKKVLKHEENKLIIQEFNDEKDDQFSALKDFFCSLFFKTQV